MRFHSPMGHSNAGQVFLVPESVEEAGQLFWVFQRFGSQSINLQFATFSGLYDHTYNRKYNTPLKDQDRAEATTPTNGIGEQTPALCFDGFRIDDVLESYKKEIASLEADKKELTTFRESYYKANNDHSETKRQLKTATAEAQVVVKALEDEVMSLRKLIRAKVNKK